jgi:osmoprotectant transport system permease protein
MKLRSAKFAFLPGWIKSSRVRDAVNALSIAKCLAVMFILIPPAANAQQIQVGSKRFTESYVLGEIAKRLLEDAGFTVEHKQGMGGTIIVWRALTNGDISMYPDYTGTVQETILKSKTPLTLEQMRAALAEHGIGMTEELGFNNTYAFAMRRETAESFNLRTISDLRQHPNLKLGFTHEFLNRKDGWEPLSKHYGLQMRPRGMEHSLTYVALNSGDIDLTDAYSTDAKLGEYDLAVLEDDLEFFPKYNAVFLYRLDTDQKAISAIQALGRAIDEARMIQLNVAAERMKDYTRAAALYFVETEQGGEEASTTSANSKISQFFSKIVPLTGEHLTLVAISMFLAVIIGIPLGIRASRPGLFSQFILGLTGIIQTIPSIVLLAVLIPILGTNMRNAIAALFLYSLLPIVRNTTAGLQDIPTPIRESAAALGLEPRVQLTKVFLPMASRSILAGVKTSTVINIGTATLAGFIGAGGYGELILSGINLNATDVILQGAIPAALLALLSQFLFDFLDRVVIPRGLRLQASA